MFSADKDQRYLIRVGEQFDSESGDFTLELFRPEPEAQAAGPPAAAPWRRRHGRPRAGSHGRLVEAAAAGTPYVVTDRVALGRLPDASRCTSRASASFDFASPVDGSRCNAHNLFTPERSGRHSFLVRAGRGERGPQEYRLRVRARHT